MNPDIADVGEFHAALYIRLSREDEGEGPSQSVQNQEALLREFAEKNQLTIYRTYIDDGFSGTSFDRPAFKRMLDDIESHKVNMVLTKDLSRLGRDYIMTGHYMERYFPEHRVRYISLLDGIDTGIDSSANDITPFRAIMNDMYAKDISKKIKSVKRDKQRRGQFIGGKPVYGYKMHPTEKNRIVIDEEAAAVVRQIFLLALSGMSCRKIAEQLNQNSVLTPASYAHLPISHPGPYSGLWSSERISEMLRNETYIGSMVQGKSMRVSYKSRKCLKQPPENWIVVEHTHEPIIDPEIFHKVGQLLASRRSTRSRTYDYLLKGMIFCHECGHPLSVINRKNSRGEDVLYFVCRTYQRFTKAGVCTSHTIKEQTVNEAVLSRIRTLCLAAVDREKLQSIAEESLRQNCTQSRIRSELTSVQKQLSSLMSNLDRMYLDRLKGLLAEEDFFRIYRRLKQDQSTLEKKKCTIQMRLESDENITERAGKLVNGFLQSGLSDRQILVDLIERVELTESRNVVVKFRFLEFSVL